MSHKILIAEPEQESRERLSKLAGREGLEPYPAGSGSEAVRVVRMIPFDVALMELYLPDLTAFELLGAIRRLRRRVHSVILVESSSKELQMKVMNAGVYTVIKKPFSDEVVTFTINEILRKFFPV